MPQTLDIDAGRSGARRRTSRHTSWLLRGLGLALLALLLWRLDAAQVIVQVRRADPLRFGLAFIGLLPLIWLKTVRWQALLHALGLRYRLRPAYLAYFGSLYVGLLTPGRLGEFVKAAYVQAECGATGPQALTSVLADRLFDLAALLVVGAAALVALPTAAGQAGAALVVVLAVSALGGWLLLDRRGVALIQAVGARLGPWASGWVGSPQSRLVQLHHALRALSLQTLFWAGALTALAYALYFGQCWLLAQAAGLPVGVGPVSYAVALGSLVTLLPISISGLGTREATLILYLGAAGVQPEAALGFSLLIFAVFYVGSGALGLVAWWLKPAPWPRANLEMSGRLHTGEEQE